MKNDTVIPSAKTQAMNAGVRIFQSAYFSKFHDGELVVEAYDIYGRIINEADMMAGCLKKKAFESDKSIGRCNNYEDNELVSQFLGMDPFEIDAYKIAESKAYRKLDDKTQVYTFVENPYVRTRLSHTIEVESIAVLLATILGLNIHLVRAIARGHDIGHVPFGHEGERFFAKISGKECKHALISAIVAQRIEHEGKGLNLCFETLQGITRHSTGKENPEEVNGYPLEYVLVAIADQLAYVFSDINDALRLGNIDLEKIPEQMLKLGNNQRDRLMVCILAIAKESMDHFTVSFGNSHILKLFLESREWMYTNVYSQIDQIKLILQLEKVYEYFHDSKIFSPRDPLLALSLLTNKEVAKIYQFLGNDRRWSNNVLRYLKEIELFKVMRHLPRENPFDFNGVDLDPEHYN